MSHEVDTSPFTVALIQAPPRFLNLAASVDRAVELIEDAASAGARVVVFPETWLPGYPVWIDSAPGAALWNSPAAQALFRLLRRNAPELPGPEIDRVLAAAGQAGVHLVIGVHERRGGTLYNTMIFAGPDGATRLHRKLVPTYTERLVWGQGDGSTLEALATPFGTLGGLVCWEHWMPHARTVMHAQREVLHVAQWPWVHDLHLLCSRQYAFEGQCWVAASGCALTLGDVLAGFDSLACDEPAARDLLESMAGSEDTPLLRGGSCLIGPDATHAPQVLDDPAMVLGTVDPARIDEGLMTLDTAGHYSRPDVFRLDVDTTPRVDIDPLGRS